MKHLLWLFIVLFFTSCNNKKGEEIISSKPLETTGNELLNYIEYCNERFNVCFDYPSNFDIQAEPANGDGRTFVNESDSAVLTFYGVNDLLNEGLDGQFNFIQETVNIQSLDTLDHALMIKAINDEGFVHYEKLVEDQIAASENTEVSPIVYSLLLTFPKSKKEKYDKFWNQISNSLKY